MKNLLLCLLACMLVFSAFAQDSNQNDCNCDEIIESHLTLADLSPEEKVEAFEAMMNGDCYYKNIKLYGKVQFVTSFPDIKIQYVESFPDIRVEFVSSFADKCGRWQVVESFPDFKVEVVESFPDIKVKVVNSFPGMD